MRSVEVPCCSSPSNERRHSCRITSKMEKYTGSDLEVWHHTKVESVLYHISNTITSLSFNDFVVLLPIRAWLYDLKVPLVHLIPKVKICVNCEYSTFLLYSGKYQHDNIKGTKIFQKKFSYFSHYKERKREDYIYSL